MMILDSLIVCFVPGNGCCGFKDAEEGQGALGPPALFKDSLWSLLAVVHCCFQQIIFLLV